MKTLPAQIQAEHTYLKRLLEVLRDEYRLDYTDPTSLSFHYRVGPNTFASSLTLDVAEDDTDRWTINRTVSSGGGRWEPPDVDIAEVAGPMPWNVACLALVLQLFEDQLAALGENLADQQLFDDLANEEALLVGYDPLDTDPSEGPYGDS